MKDFESKREEGLVLNLLNRYFEYNCVRLQSSWQERMVRCIHAAKIRSTSDIQSISAYNIRPIFHTIKESHKSDLASPTCLQTSCHLTNSARDTVRAIFPCHEQTVIRPIVTFGISVAQNICDFLYLISNQEISFNYNQQKYMI